MLAEIMQAGWNGQPALRPEFLTIEPRIAALKPDEEAPTILSAEPQEANVLSNADMAAAKEHFQSTPKKYSVFLSHHKNACAADARLVKEKLDAILGVEAFLGTFTPY